MKKGLIALIVSLLAISAGIVYIKKKGNLEKTNEKCCETCKAGEEKYTLLKDGKCSIMCLSQDELSERIKYNDGIKSINEQDCFKNGFTVYDSTSIKGSSEHPLKVDIYKKP